MVEMTNIDCYVASAPRNDKKCHRHRDKYAWSVFERVLYTRPEGRNPWMGGVAIARRSKCSELNYYRLLRTSQ